jgi:hypothetical protein
LFVRFGRVGARLARLMSVNASDLDAPVIEPVIEPAANKAEAAPSEPEPDQAPCAPLFVPPGHYYSPVVDPGEAERTLAALETAPQPTRLPDVAIDHEAMLRLWGELLPDLNAAPFPDQQSDGFHYFCDNTAYSWGDGLIYYAMLRRWRPRRIVEVGSGYSSALLVDTLARAWPEPCEITFVEPNPEVIEALLGAELDRFRLIASPVQACPIEVFTSLRSGDFLFIDSTHVLKTGSDVHRELFEILPALAPGVIIHFHDMFWPFEYPRHWAVEENRSWNELYAMRALLSGNAEYEVLMFNDYMAKVEPALVSETCPRFLFNPGGALWLRKRGGLKPPAVKRRRATRRDPA